MLNAETPLKAKNSINAEYILKPMATKESTIKKCENWKSDYLTAENKMLQPK